MGSVIVADSEVAALRAVSRAPGLCVLAVARATAAWDAALEALAARREDVPVVRIDADRATALQERHQIGAADTLLFLRGGVEVGRLVGPAAPARMLLALECACEAPAGAELMRG